MRFRTLVSICCLYLCTSLTSLAQLKNPIKVESKHRSLNPITPVGLYIADPEVRKMPDGRIYLYGSRDEPGTPWCSNWYNVLSSDDLVNWSVEQYSFATKGIGKQADYTEAILYAPDCIHYNGKYYLYYCLAGGGHDEGVAIADSPYGPFRDGKIIEGMNGIDPTVLIDDDGQPYIFWGQASGKGAKLSKDMVSIDGEIHDKLITYHEHYFNEGMSIRKIKGTYYLLYGGHQRHGESNCATLNYATADKPFGPYTYRGVVVDNWGSSKNLENNHGSLFEHNGQWYVVYHRSSHGGSSMRKTCIEPITINKDGSIDEVEMTTQGIGGYLEPTLRMEAARACLMNGNVTAIVRRPSNDLAVEYLSEIHDGDYAYWKYYDFSKEKVNSFICKTWDKNEDAKIEIRLDSPDGELLGVCNIEQKDDGVAYAIHQTKIKQPKGVHALVLVFKSTDGNQKGKDLMNLEWFSFENR